MRVTLLYFAVARERAGLSREVLELPANATAGSALLAACAAHPQLSPLAEKLRVAVDEQFAPLSTLLREGSEVALIPPVSGGHGGLRTISSSDETISSGEEIK